MKPNPRRLDAGIYPYRFDITTRFADLDPNRHLNNVRLMEYYQEARVMFHAALHDEFAALAARDGRTLVAHQSIDYLGEVGHPGKVTVGVGVLRVGTSSFTLGLGMFQEGRCTGIAATVIVHSDNAGPSPLPGSLREILKKKLLPEDAR